MTHPTPEDWMDYLYDEAAPERRAELDAHLARCEECRARVDEWRRAMGALDTWQLDAPAPIRIGTRRGTWLLRAAAAIALVCLGFGLARLAPGAGVNEEELQAAADALRPGVVEQVRAELSSELTSTRDECAALAEAAEARTLDAVARALAQAELRRARNDEALRSDLVRLAVATDDELVWTRAAVGQLTDWQAVSEPWTTPAATRQWPAGATTEPEE